MFDLLNSKYFSDYNTKKELLISNHIGLWDVLCNCERKGSLDSNIKNYQPNDFDELYKGYPNIQHIYFNGSKAFQIYRSKIGFNDHFTYTMLASTSPAYTLKYDQKLNN
jgi:hypoxanthine-DNA glycosylase